MSKSFSCAVVLVATHLVLVACGGLNLSVSAVGGPIGRAIAWYSALSGADSGYAFFVSPIASETQAEFLLVDREGNAWTESLAWATSSEANMRLKNTVDTMVNYENIRPAVAASWAALFFGRYPDVTTVEVHVVGQRLPKMSEYRTGQRPEWGTVFYEVFRREAPPRGNVTT